jgi:hypothetical protein
MGADIFISYAHQDGVAAEEVCRILDTLKVSFWVDLEGIRGGYIFHTEIVAAIKACRMVLLLCSKASLASKYVRKEILVAWTENKLYLPLVIEPVDMPDELRIPLEGVQYVSLHGKNWERREALVTAAVRALLSGDATVPAPAPANLGVDVRPGAHSNETKTFRSLLVDRGLQRADVASALEARFQGDSDKLLMFLVHGAEDECIEAFLERLQRLDLPRMLRRMGRDDRLQWHDCGWPPYELPLEERLKCLRRELADCLATRLSASLEDIHQKIVDSRTAFIFSFHMAAKNWRPEDKKLLMRWFEDWADLPGVPDPAMLIFFVSTKYPPIAKGMLGMLLWHPNSTKLRKVVATLPAELPSRVAALAVHELLSVPRHDVEQWAREVARPHDIVGMMQGIRMLYADRSLVRSRCIAMAPLSVRLRGLIETYAEGHPS